MIGFISVFYKLDNCPVFYIQVDCDTHKIKDFDIQAVSKLVTINQTMYVFVQPTCENQ